MPITPMKPAEYIQLRKQLGLSNYALRVYLGISLSSAQRYESGNATIPEPIAALLRMYARHGIPKD